MSHELDINADGDARMFSVRQKPWHDLGKVIPSGTLTVAEALGAADLKWQVVPMDVYLNVPDSGVATSGFTKIIGKRAVVRDEDFAVLGMVSTAYKPLQNTEAFDWFDPLVQAGKAEYESAGALCGGKKVWIQARLMTPRTINGEVHKPYITLVNGHDGSTAVMVLPCLQRVVCMNTLRVALGEGGIMYFQHTGNIVKKIEQAKEVLGLVEQKLDAFQYQLEELARHPIGVDGMEKYLDELLGIDWDEVPLDEAVVTDGELGKRAKENREAIKARILELHESGITVTPGTGTYLGAYNSVVAFVDHWAGPRVKDRANYLLLGDGGALKDKALALAMEMALG